jgi:hypothetical protein
MIYPSISENQFRVSPTKGDHADPVYSGRKVKTGCAMEAISKKTDFPDEIAIKLNFNLSILEMSHEGQQAQKDKKAAQWANNSDVSCAMAEFREKHIHRAWKYWVTISIRFPDFRMWKTSRSGRAGK